MRLVFQRLTGWISQKDARSPRIAHYFALIFEITRSQA